MREGVVSRIPNDFVYIHSNRKNQKLLFQNQNDVMHVTSAGFFGRGIISHTSFVAAHDTGSTIFVELTGIVSISTMGVFGMCICASVAGKPFLRAVARKLHPKNRRKPETRAKNIKILVTSNLD